jgi:hypothetical protein
MRYVYKKVILTPSKPAKANRSLAISSIRQQLIVNQTGTQMLRGLRFIERGDKVRKQRGIIRLSLCRVGEHQMSLFVVCCRVKEVAAKVRKWVL